MNDFPIGPRTYAEGGPAEVLRKARVRGHFDALRGNIRNSELPEDRKAHRLERLDAREAAALENGFDPTDQVHAADLS